MCVHSTPTAHLAGPPSSGHPAFHGRSLRHCSARVRPVRDIAGVSQLALAGLPCLVDWTVHYLRASFHGECLFASPVGTLLAALRRYVSLVRASGGDLPDTASHFSVLWRRHRSWPRDVALAVAVTSWLLGWPVRSILTLLYDQLMRGACDGAACTASQKPSGAAAPACTGFSALGSRRHGACQVTRVGGMRRRGVVARGALASRSRGSHAAAVDFPRLEAPGAVLCGPAASRRQGPPAHPSRAPRWRRHRALDSARHPSITPARPLDVRTYAGTPRPRGSILLACTTPGRQQCRQNPGARHAGAELLRKRAPRPTTNPSNHRVDRQGVVGGERAWCRAPLQN